MDSLAMPPTKPLGPAVSILKPGAFIKPSGRKLGLMARDVKPREDTHNPAARNTMVNPNLFVQSAFILQIIGMGIAIIIKSVTRWGRLVHVPKTRRSRHRDRSGGYSHSALGGSHAAAEGTKKAIALAVKNAMRI